MRSAGSFYTVLFHSCLGKMFLFLIVLILYLGSVYFSMFIERKHFVVEDVESVMFGGMFYGSSVFPVIQYTDRSSCGQNPNLP